jgi:hypothetical protein
VVLMSLLSACRPPGGVRNNPTTDVAIPCPDTQKRTDVTYLRARTRDGRSTALLPRRNDRPADIHPTAGLLSSIGCPRVAGETSTNSPGGRGTVIHLRLVPDVAQQTL